MNEAGEEIPDPGFDPLAHLSQHPSHIELAKRLAALQHAMVTDLKEVHCVVGEMICRLSTGEDSVAPCPFRITRERLAYLAAHHPDAAVIARKTMVVVLHNRKEGQRV